MKSGPTRILVSGNPPPLAVHRASDLTSRSPVGTFFQLQFFFPGIALGKNFPPFLSFVDFLWLFWLAPFEKRKKTTKLLHEFALRMDSKGLFSRFQREKGWSFVNKVVSYPMRDILMEFQTESNHSKCLWKISMTCVSHRIFLLQSTRPIWGSFDTFNKCQLIRVDTPIQTNYRKIQRKNPVWITMSLWKNTIFMSVHPTGFFCRELPWSLTGFPHRHSANQPADRNPSLSLSSKYSQSSTADASQAQSQVISLPIFQLFPYRKVKPFTWFINSIQSTGNLSIWKAPHNGVGWPLEKTNVSDGQWGPSLPRGVFNPPPLHRPFHNKINRSHVAART